MCIGHGREQPEDWRLVQFKLHVQQTEKNPTLQARGWMYAQEKGQLQCIQTCAACAEVHLITALLPAY